jgi:N utilization substance protein B
MALRRKAREFALQMLFQWDLNRQKPAQIEATFWKQARAEKSTREFAERLLEGAVHDCPALDKLITQHAKNWRLDRLAAMDRAILRLAIYELTGPVDTPPKVAINEALELAKRYSAEDSVPFINGILDAVRKSNEE